MGKLVTTIILWVEDQEALPVCLVCIGSYSDEDIGRQTIIEPAFDEGDGVQCEICATWHLGQGLILSDEEKESYDQEAREAEDDGSCSTCGGSGGGDYGGIQCGDCNGSGSRPRHRHLRDEPDEPDDYLDDDAADAAADRYERRLGL